MPLTVFFIVAGTAAIHALFGVGLLLFGTPILLLLGYDYLTILEWLLPIALAINLLQVGLYYTHVDWRFYRFSVLVSLPWVIACSLVMTHIDLAIGPIIGVLLILVALQRISSRTNTILTHLMRHEGVYCALMGAVQGLTSLGGSLLSALIQTKPYDKHTARATTAATYGTFVSIQLLLLLNSSHPITQASTQTIPLALVGLGAFAVVEHTLYAKLDRDRYKTILAGFLLASGLLLIGKSAFTY